MNPEILISVRNILVTLYPDDASIRRILADAGIDSPRIQLNSTLANNWHSVLAESARLDRIEALFGVIEIEYGSNLDWRAACSSYRRAASQSIPPQAPLSLPSNGQHIQQGRRFDPQKFIDREFEQELFEELLQLKDQARILAIKDTGGMGKSQLLQKFQYRCRTAGRPRIPVSLVDLGQLPDNSPLSLVQQLEKELSAFLKFPTFAHLDAARRAYDFTTIRGTIDLRGTNLRQVQFPAVFTPEQQAMAQERCVEAFWVDLVEYCRQQLVVLLFDSFEKCTVDLQKWLLDYILEPYCFNLAQRPASLLIIIAGREIPNFEQYWSIDECKMIIKSVRALGKWTAAHVEECLRIYGYDNFEPQDVNAFHRFIVLGFSPHEIVNLIQTAIALHRK